MKTVKVKTSELKSAALNWAAFCAVYKGMEPTINILPEPTFSLGGIPLVSEKIVHLTYIGAYNSVNYWHPSSDWDRAGDLIERFIKGIELVEENQWCAHTENRSAFGETPLIASMRAIVMERSGLEVGIPEDLL